MNELRNRGTEDILLAVVDGLKGFPEAITAVFPDAVVQTCIVHLLRNSMDFVSWKDRKGLATALKEVYRAPTAEVAEQALTAFEAGPWGTRYPAIGQSWRRAWAEVIPFFAFPDEVRRIIYTTNAIEALNSTLRRAVRARGHFPSDEAATRLLYLILNRSEKEWRMPPREWTMAKAQFAVIFGERFILVTIFALPRLPFFNPPHLFTPVDKTFIHWYIGISATLEYLAFFGLVMWGNWNLAGIFGFMIATVCGGMAYLSGVQFYSYYNLVYLPHERREMLYLVPKISMQGRGGYQAWVSPYGLRTWGLPLSASDYRAYRAGTLTLPDLCYRVTELRHGRMIGIVEPPDLHTPDALTRCRDIDVRRVDRNTPVLL